MRLLNKSVAGLSLGFLACVYQVHAQQGPLVVSPSQLTFTTSNSLGPAAPQNLVVLSNTGSALAFTAAASSAGNWLTVAPQSGNTPQVISVTANAGSLGAGTYSGFVTITSSSGFTTVPVTLNVGLTGPTPLSFSPSTLVFSFPAGATAPQTQQLSIGSGTFPVGFTASSSTSSGANWLSITPTSGTTSSPLSVTVNPTGLGIGVYFGAIAVNAPGTTGAVITVVTNVGFPTAINVNPQQLTFVYQTGTPAPPAQTINLTTTEGPVAFTVNSDLSACQGNWIVITPSSGIAPATLTVQANPSGLSLTPTTCYGNIYIYAPGAVNQMISLPVALLVSTMPVLQVPTTGPTIIYQSGTTTPAPITIPVTSSSTTLPFTVTAAPANGGPDFVTLSPATGTSPQSVTVSINPTVLAGLAPNTYAENLTFTSQNSAIPNETMTITLVVTNNPMLVASQPALNFNYQIGQANPQSQNITVTSTGAPLSFNVATNTTTCNGFLSATTSSGQTSISGAPAQITVTAKGSGLSSAQTCMGTLTITPSGSNATPINIPITLNVSSTALLNASPQIINATAVSGGSPVTQTVALSASDQASALNFTATAATSPANMSWLSVTPPSGPTPSSVTVTLNPAGLVPGVYTGSITVASTALNLVQTIPVAFTVASGTVAAAPTSLTFSQTFNGALPASQTIQLTGIPQGATFSASGTVFNGANWLGVSTSGNTITVSPNGTLLNRGTYTGVITVIAPGVSNSPLYVPITFTVN